MQIKSRQNSKQEQEMAKSDIKASDSEMIKHRLQKNACYARNSNRKTWVYEQEW